MQQDSQIISFLPQLAQRFQSLIWSCLDSDLTKTAVFHAEQYFALDKRNHDSRHLYATALLREGQTYSALTLVNLSQDIQCSGCLEIQARCCTALGRHRQAREALEATLHDPAYIPTGPFFMIILVLYTYISLASTSTSSRPARIFPDEAALRCRSGTMALKGNLSEMASLSFRQALALNPQLWEAFEGLCALGMSVVMLAGDTSDCKCTGSIPEIDEIFPPRPSPVKRAPTEEAQAKIVPVATGAGFFTPDTGNAGNLLRTWKPDIAQPQPFRMNPPSGPRDSM